MSVLQEISGALDAIFSSAQVAKQDKPTLLVVEQELAKLDQDAKLSFTEYLLNSTLPQDNPLSLYFFLFDCLGDTRFLERAAKYLPSHYSVQGFYEAYLNISHRLFTAKRGSKALELSMRQSFTQLSSDIRKFMQSRGLIRRVACNGKPKRLAIISPQLLTMRHSPTREAFSMALHLEAYHGCEVYVFNTNAMHYESQHKLGLVTPVKYNVNDSLNGEQVVHVDYMQFSADVKILSFAAGEMNTQKLANIANTLYQLNIEAVIAHGENLLAMDMLFGQFPSLFATTGAVVPMAHCDAYFIPGNLYDDRAKDIAEKYGHDNFMLESMLVTPEGISETPAQRSQFGLEPENFVYLVVGQRLKTELEPGFCQVCQRLLEADPRARVIFAGTDDLDLLLHFPEGLVTNKAVQNIGFQQDLPAISAMSDVYLNPKRSGGGTSSQTAIINGLPVVTLDVGHISAIVPSDRRHPVWDKYMEYAQQLMREPAYLEAEVALYKQHYYANLDAKGQVARMYQKLCEVSEDY